MTPSIPPQQPQGAAPQGMGMGAILALMLDKLKAQMGAGGDKDLEITIKQSTPKLGRAQMMQSMNPGQGAPPAPMPLMGGSNG